MIDRVPLALLPGLLCDAALWRHQLEALAGHAEPRVADLTYQESIAAMAQSVLEDMPERFALAGLSMGGYVAFEIMRQAPERVLRLALLDTRAGPDTDEEATRRRGLIELTEKGEFKGVTPRLLPLFLHPAHCEDEALAGEVVAMAERVGREAFVRQQKAILARPDSRPTMVAVHCPTLVLCGRQDALTPVDDSMTMAAGIRDSRLRVIEDCGHLSTMERPEAVNAEMIAWLEADPTETGPG